MMKKDSYLSGYRNEYFGLHDFIIEGKIIDDLSTIIKIFGSSFEERIVSKQLIGSCKTLIYIRVFFCCFLLCHTDGGTCPEGLRD